jgi:gamma-glutamyltranspeptidase
MNGIGGGGFMLIRSSNGSFTFVDFRETAPSAASQDMYSGGNFNLSKYGGLARYGIFKACPSIMWSPS